MALICSQDVADAALAIEHIAARAADAGGGQLAAATGQGVTG